MIDPAYCANFILTYCRSKDHDDYRKKCLAFWKEKYGPDFAKTVEGMVRKGWEKK